MKQEKAMIRINSRIRADQDKFIKTAAKKAGVSEGQTLRDVIDFFISNHKK